MTAFNDILTTEAEAAQSIEAAQTAAAAAVTEARAAGQSRIAAVSKELADERVAKLATQEKVVTEMTDKIIAGVQTNVAAIEKKFDAHTTELIAELKKHFS